MTEVNQKFNSNIITTLLWRLINKVGSRSGRKLVVRKLQFVLGHVCLFSHLPILLLTY